MKYLLKVILALLIFFVKYEDGDAKIEMIYNFTVTDDSISRAMAVGISDDATDSIDANFGERDLPPIPPVDGIYPLFHILYKGYGDLWSPVDIRPTPKVKSQKYYKYIFYSNKVAHDEFYKISWNKGYNRYIDSMFITDDRTDKNIIKVYMKDTNELYVTRYQFDLFIHIYFNTDQILDVQSESIDRNNIKIYPNPSKDYIKIDNSQINSFEIYDLFGNTISGRDNIESENLNSCKIDITNIKNGVYLLKTVDIKGIQQLNKFIINR